MAIDMKYVRKVIIVFPYKELIYEYATYLRMSHDSTSWQIHVKIYRLIKRCRTCHVSRKYNQQDFQQNSKKTVFINIFMQIICKNVSHVNIYDWLINVKLIVFRAYAVTKVRLWNPWNS